MYKQCKYWILSFVGGIYYLLKGACLSRTYFDMLNLFLVTNGRSNDLLANFVALKSPRRAFLRFDSSVIDKEFCLETSTDQMLKNLVVNGYSEFDGILEQRKMSEILKFASGPNFRMRKMDGEREKSNELVVFDKNCDRAIAFDADLNKLINVSAIQDLIINKSFLEIAQKYFGAPPVIDYPAMWWLNSHKGIPDNEAAQKFHFDFERIKWLKIFIYLTDVTKDCGPHVFVKSSHLSGSLPEEIRKLGYVRLEDHEVEKFFDKNTWKTFIGKPGSAFVEDTRGLHKGGVPSSGHSRLLLQFQYCNSLFLSNLPKIPFPKEPSRNFLKMYNENSSLFQGFEHA